MPCTNNDKSDRIIYMQFKDVNPNALDYVSLFKYLVMWLNYTLLMYGTSDGLIAVVDSKSLSWRHIIKIPLGTTSRMLKFLEVSTTDSYKFIIKIISIILFRNKTIEIYKHVMISKLLCA